MGRDRAAGFVSFVLHTRAALISDEQRTGLSGGKDLAWFYPSNPGNIGGQRTQCPTVAMFFLEMVG